MPKKPSYEELEKKIKELEESERKYRHLFETAMVGMYRTRIEDGKLLAANQTLAELMGYDSVDQFIAEYVTSNHYTDPKRREELLRQIQTQGRVDGFEIEMARPDGSVVSILISAAAYPEYGYLEGVVVDITDRKQAEEALRKTEERFRTVFMSAPVGIAIARPEGRFIEVNNTVCEMLGYTDEELREMTFVDITFPDDRGETLKLAEEVWDGKSDFYQVEKRYFKKDGSPVWATVSATAVRDSNEKIQYWVGIIVDITERKRMEEERIRLATAVEQAAESVIISDRPGTIQYVNPAFERLSGFTREEIVGQNFRVLKSDRHDESFYKNMWNIISRGDVWEGHIINTMKDGKLREFETIISPIRNSAGVIVNFVSVNRDVTHEVALQARLQQAQKIEAIGTLTGGIAHDFNNILSIIIGNTELATDYVPKWHPARFNLDEIRTASTRAKDVVRQLLSFARKTELEQKPINISPIVKESIKLLRSSIPTNIEIRQNITKDVDPILADPSRINQVLINLCTNAFHAMPDGGIMEVSLKNMKFNKDTAAKHPNLKPGRYVNLTVSDTGRGVSEEEVERIFDPYFTTKEVGKGTGLGLSVVHGIVKSHKGEISVDSKLGKRTTINIYFPVTEGEVEALRDTETDEKLPVGSERILFVDDEESNVFVGLNRLGRLGYQVEAQTNPVEAVKLFQANPDEFDLVITDMTMPQMSGDQLVKEILKIRPDIPMILCTGFSEKIDKEKATEIGIRQYIEKPLDRREFARLVRKVLDEK